MSILTKEVEVTPNGRMISYYKNKGYDAKYHQPLIVKVEDLSKWCTEKIEVLCDMCQKNSMFVKYGDYNKVIEKTGNYVCKECAKNKAKQTSLKKYGVEVVTQLSSTIDKAKQTNLKKYGVDSYTKTKEYFEKAEETMKKKYGVSHALQSKVFQDAYKNTCLKKYGENYNKVFGKMASNAYYEKTGYLSPSQSPEVRKKISETLYKNGTVQTSRQQLYVFNLYNLTNKAKLNYPISRYNADICFPEDKLDIEIDCSGHNLPVRKGYMTQEEFNQKEIIRSNVVKREGYKQMRIISKKDLLPSDNILFQMLDMTKEYFIQYPEHSWIEYNIDTSTVRNAEHKDGIYFDYGVLRKIK